MASLARKARLEKLLRGLRGFFRQLFGRLAVPQVGVKAAKVEQLVVSSAFDRSALVENHDLVGIDDGRKAVCDHDRGPALGDPVERFLNGLLGSAVER